MATLRDAVQAVLTGSAALLAEFSGGVLDANDVFREGIASPQAPRQADGVRLAPFIALRWREASSYQSEHPKLGAERETVEIYFYDDVGYARLERGISLVKGLLHDHYLTTEDRAMTHLLYVHSSGEVPAQELSQAPSRFSRYQIINIRK